ncbi:tumor necrosis factor receptor superfamily member 23-like [Petaurus breviceps papuanus]|uniref:tumor necrosis factor receptor superfamily member 23-like n=1 Tax=Petaurus breviceps papuanus TaxID=3040969 RepID=UPI0036D97C86
MGHGAVRFFALLALLLVMRKSESALQSKQNYRASRESCDLENEYWHVGRCCLHCPAGTHVKKHCTMSHTLGDCKECPPGKYAPKNELKTCQQCAQCREDQEMLIPCYKYINTKCQCKEGYFCEAPDCKVCQPCTKRCPEGKQILQICNATADILCGVPETGIIFQTESSTVRGSTSDWSWILIHLVFSSCWWGLLGF